jgi:general secretion pathway protein M
MTASTRIERYLARFPRVAAGAYAALVMVLGFVIWGAVADILEHRAALAASLEILEQLQGRRSTASGAAGSDETIPTGSPFLEGPTVTVAGAALLQRMAGAVTKVGGSVLSSQVELQGTQSKAGMLGVIVSCELDQPALQQLLYDLEAGMPFLFVEQLVVQAPMASSSGAQEGRMRVLLAIYGQWQGGK